MRHTTSYNRRNKKAIIILLALLSVIGGSIAYNLISKTPSLGSELELNSEVKAKFTYNGTTNGSYSWFDGSISSLDVDVSIEITGQTRNDLQNQVQRYTTINLNVENGRAIPFAVNNCNDVNEVTTCYLQKDQTFNVLGAFGQTTDMVGFVTSAIDADRTGLKYWTSASNEILNGTVHIYFASLTLSGGGQNEMEFVTFENTQTGANDVPKLDFNITHSGIKVTI